VPEHADRHETVHIWGNTGSDEYGGLRAVGLSKAPNLRPKDLVLSRTNPRAFLQSTVVNSIKRGKPSIFAKLV
jgi:hypothetical protein